jgi:hypothetical protein
MYQAHVAHGHACHTIGLQHYRHRHMHGVFSPCVTAPLNSAPTAAAALVLGSSTYPRPCSGFSGMDQQKCFCDYHPSGGEYVWPFSDNKKKCREVMSCKSTNPFPKACRMGNIANDEGFNGQSRCIKQPDGYNCGTGGTPDSPTSGIFFSSPCSMHPQTRRCYSTFAPALVAASLTHLRACGCSGVCCFKKHIRLSQFAAHHSQTRQ